jgi:hypothetical protein
MGEGVRTLVSLHCTLTFILTPLVSPLRLCFEICHDAFLCNQFHHSYTQFLVSFYLEGPGEERVKSNFINFPFSLPSGALKCVLSNNTNRIWKKELGQKIVYKKFQNRFPYCLSTFSKLKNALLKKYAKPDLTCSFPGPFTWNNRSS